MKTVLGDLFLKGPGQVFRGIILAIGDNALQVWLLSEGVEQHHVYMLIPEAVAEDYHALAA